jgi:hypothetical protein
MSNLEEINQGLDGIVTYTKKAGEAEQAEPTLADIKTQWTAASEMALNLGRALTALEKMTKDYHGKTPSITAERASAISSAEVIRGSSSQHARDIFSDLDTMGNVSKDWRKNASAQIGAVSSVKNDVLGVMIGLEEVEPLIGKQEELSSQFHQAIGATATHVESYKAAQQQG